MGADRIVAWREFTFCLVRFLFFLSAFLVLFSLSSDLNEPNPFKARTRTKRRGVAICASMRERHIATNTTRAYQCERRVDERQRETMISLVIIFFSFLFYPNASVLIIFIHICDE